MVEGNEEKLVEAGAVEHYVTLLTDTQRDRSRDDVTHGHTPVQRVNTERSCSRPVYDGVQVSTEHSQRTPISRRFVSLSVT